MTVSLTPHPASLPAAPRPLPSTLCLRASRVPPRPPRAHSLMPSPTLSFKAHATIGRTMFLFPPLLKVCFLPTEYRFCLLPYLQGLEQCLTPTASGTRVGQAGPLSRNQETRCDKFIKNDHFRTLAGNLRSVCTLGKHYHDWASMVRRGLPAWGSSLLFRAVKLTALLAEGAARAEDK